MFDNLKSTTVVSAVYGSGAIIAADRQATGGHDLHKLPYDVFKIVGLTDFAMAGISGFPKTLETLEEVKRVFGLWKILYDREVSIEGQFNFLKRVPLIVPVGKEVTVSGILMAAFDRDIGKGRVFLFDPALAMEIPNYAAIGSGGTACFSALELGQYRTDMRFEEAVRKVSGALRYSHEHNAGVGDNFFGFQLDAGGIREISSLLNAKEVG
ncbi:MAG: hypothetical protein HZC14_03020 [Candidatus Niyogibacteria bacterium]|nr:hypothetical protein [Candidatus Niyogibacteria bacterium]